MAPKRSRNESKGKEKVGSSRQGGREERLPILSRLNAEQIKIYEKMAAKPIPFEKRVVFAGDRAEILARIGRAYNITDFLARNRPVRKQMVREFYSTFYLNGDGVSASARVQGQTVTVSPNIINSMYGFALPPPSVDWKGDPCRDDFVAYATGNGDFTRSMEEYFLMPGTSIEIPATRAKFLTTEARIVHHLVSFRFIPTGNRKEVRKENLALTYVLMRNLGVDFGSIIYAGITKSANITSRSLLFSSVITDLCMEAGIVPEPHDEAWSDSPIDNRALGQVTGYDKPGAAHGGEEELGEEEAELERGDEMEVDDGPQPWYGEPGFDLPEYLDTRFGEFSERMEDYHSRYLSTVETRADQAIQSRLQRYEDQWTNHMNQLQGYGNQQQEQWNAQMKQLEDYQRQQQEQWNAQMKQLGDMFAGFFPQQPPPPPDA